MAIDLEHPVADEARDRAGAGEQIFAWRAAVPTEEAHGQPTLSDVIQTVESIGWRLEQIAHAAWQGSASMGWMLIFRRVEA
jgi:hypothetical protein